LENTNKDSAPKLNLVKNTSGGDGASSSNTNSGNAGGNAGNPSGSVTSIGGMTLKKRAPGAPAPSGGSSQPTPRPSGGGGFQGGGGQFGRPSGPSPNVQKRMERFSRTMPSRDPGVRMNENIRAAEIRVIDDEGQVGILSPREALEIARERGVDLIEIVPNAQPPVCKLIDFGKWKYEQQKRDKMAKKSSHQQLLKEIRFHPSTDTHDFDFKVRHAKNFLGEGHKVKATVQFKGREIAYKQFGEDLLRKFIEQLTDISKVDQDVQLMGKSMSVTLSPTGKRKKEDPVKKNDSKKEGKKEKKESDELANHPDFRDVDEDEPLEEFEEVPDNGEAENEEEASLQ